MFGFRYLKVPATSFVLQFRRGELIRQGPGLAFWYFTPLSVIAIVPVSSIDVPFAFREISADFQEVTVQGVMTYRVAEPARLATLLDYSVDSNGRYRSDDPTKLGERLVQAAQAGARQFIQAQTLRAALLASTPLAEAILNDLRRSSAVSQLGIELLGVAVTSVQADPEMAKALQAEARELLLKAADQAIYARRNAAVELERMIRENELQTEIAVALKQRSVRETQMAAEIAVEQQRRALVDTRVENEKKEAQSRGAALQAVLAPVKDVDWRVLMAMQGEAEPAAMIASAFEQLSKNAGKIGNLTITPELLAALTADKGK